MFFRQTTRRQNLDPLALKLNFDQSKGYEYSSNSYEEDYLRREDQDSWVPIKPSFQAFDADECLGYFSLNKNSY